jgi:L-fuculose-phosphate aldolase
VSSPLVDARDPDAPLEGRMRAALVLAGRRLGARGLIAAGEGNLSLRLPGGQLLVTPTGLRKDELEPDDIVRVAVDPDAPTPPHQRDRRPSSDLAIHRAVLQARPDVAAVAHAHVPAAMALTLAGETPDPATLPETALLLPRLPVVSFGEMGSADLANRIAAALLEPPDPLAGAVLLERHGAVAVGPGSAGLEAIAALETAVNRLELIDVLCRVSRDATLLRAARAATGGDRGG